MSIYKAPDGSEYDIPVDPVRRQEFAEAIKAIYPGEDIDQTTILGQAEETLKGIPRGAISLAVDIPLGAASLFDIGNDSDFVQGLRQYKDFLNTESSLAADPAYRDKWLTKLGEGLGSFLPFLGAGKIGQVMKARGVGQQAVLRDPRTWIKDPMYAVPGSLMYPTGVSEAADRVSAARELGEEVGGVAETFAELAGGIVGLSEMLPIFGLFQRVPKHALQVRGVGDRIRSALISGGQEGLQETGASLAQDLIAAGLYSDELPIGESIFDEFTIGGAVGAIADLALTAMSGRNRGSAYIREREQKARNNRISLMEEEKFERAQAQEGVEEITDTPVVVTPDIELPDKPGPSPQLEVIENPDATFSVIDVRNIEAPVIESFKNKTEAIVAKNKQETNYERRKLTANINNAAYALGMPGSSAAMITGQTIEDPNVAYVNLQTIVNFDSSLTDKQKKLFHKQKIAEGSVGPRSYQEMLDNKANSLKAIGDYMKSKGFDLKAAYSMPEAKQILSPPNYKKLLKQISTEVFTQSEEAGEPSIRSDKNEVNVNLKYIRDIAASKNIDLDFKDPAVRYAVQQWTGFQGEWKNSPRHVKELFLARLHSLPKFNTRTKFPDFRPRKYTALDVANFVASAGSQNATFTVKDLLNDENGITANDKTATEQFISDLVTSGRAEKVKGTNKYQIRKNHEFDIARRAEGFNETPEEFGERLRREGKLPEESIEKLVEDERQNQRKVLPPVEIDKKVINFNEAVEEGRTNKFARELKKQLARVGLETGVIVSNDILSTSNLAQIDGQIVFDPRATRARKELGARAGQYDRHTDIIFLSLNAVNPDGNATEDQIHDRLSQVLDREMIHAFREKDLIKDKEYEYLRKSVKRRKVSEGFDARYKGRTFYQRAVSENQNNPELDEKSSQFIEEYYVEEAIAEMYRARNFKPDIPPKAKGILDRIVKFFRAAGRAMRISGFKRTSEIFSNIEQGLVGGRERGVTRTPRELERLSPELIDVPIAQEFEEGKVEPTEPVTPPITAPQPIIPFGDIEADTDPITGIVTKPGGYSFPEELVSEVYDEAKLSSSQREQTRNAIISGLVSAGVIRQYKKSNQYEAINPDRASIDMVKWLKDNAPNEDYRILANKALESLNKLSRIGYTFPMELSSKWATHKGEVVFTRSTGSFSMSINNSPSSVKEILEGEDNYNPVIRGKNGVNFETLLHEALHSSTLAQIFSVRDGLSKNPKAVKALKQLTLVQDKVNDYISIKSKEWRDLIYNGKIEELDNIRAKESLTMQIYIEVLKTKSNSTIKAFEDHYFKYMVNGIQEGSERKDVSEFITFGFTNRQFQDFLEHIPYSPKGKQSIWNKFVETMRNLIGLPARMNTALSSFLRSASDVVDLGDIGLYPDAPTLDTGPLATKEVIYKGDIENRINEIDVELMPLESTMKKEGEEMGKRNYDILRKKIDNLVTQRFFLEQQLSKQTSRESRASRAPNEWITGELKNRISGIDVRINDLNSAFIESPLYQQVLQAGEQARQRYGGLNKFHADRGADYAMNREMDTEMYRRGRAILQKKTDDLMIQKDFLQQELSKQDDLLLREEILLGDDAYSGHMEGVTELGYGTPSSSGVYIEPGSSNEWTGEELLTLAMAHENAQIAWMAYEDGSDKYDINSMFEYSDQTLTPPGEEMSQAARQTVEGAYVEGVAQDIISQRRDDIYTSDEYIEAGGDPDVVEAVKGVEPSQTSRASRAAPIFSKGTRFADNRNTTRNIQLREATEKAIEVVKQTPRGEVPYYNANASDVALEAAVNFNEDQTAPPPPPDIPNYSRGAIPSELEESILRTGYAPSKNTSLGATLLKVINHPIESVRAMFKNFRQNYIDSLDKHEKKILAGKTTDWYLGIDEKTGKRRINKVTKAPWTEAEAQAASEEVRLANNKASTGSIHMMRIADKARGIFRELLMRGYVTDKINGKPSLPKSFNLEIKTRYNPFIDGNTGTGGLMQIFAPLYADPTVDLEAVFALYAKVKRIKTMQDNGKVIDSPVTPKDIEQLELIERKYPSVVEAYTNYQDWNNKLIEFAESKGLLSKEQSAMWREHSSYYPFYRDMVGEEGLAAPTIGGGALPSNPLNIKMEGSEREIRVNPVEAIARNSLSILTAAMKNDGVGKLLRDLQSMAEARPLGEKESKRGLNTIFVFENGNKKYYEVEDVELFYGINSIGGVNTESITKFLAIPSRILRDTVTRDPGFIIVNLFRDTLSATVTSGVPISIGGEGFTPIIDTMKNMFADMSELERFGIIGGYDFQNDEGSVKQLMDRARRQQGLSIDNGMNPEDAFYKLWDGLGSLTTKSDGATRLAAFEAVYNDMKNRGFNEADAQSEAAYQGLEIINFGRRGLSPLFRIVTASMPFTNARIQGLDVLYRSATGKYSAIDKLEQGETLKDLQSKIIRKFGLRASMIVASTLLYYLMVSDTDEYKAVKREVRDDNWIFPNPFVPGLPIKIPIPFEVGMLFKAIPERLIDYGMGAITGEGGVEKATGKSIWRQVGTSAKVPFISGDIGVQALKPFFEAYINRNSFTNTEIVPYYKLKEQPAYQARQSTNEVARLLGEALNISPMKIEHVLTGYTGTLGSYVLDIIDVFARSISGTPIMPPNINDIPVIKRLFIDLDRSGGLQQQFYELRFEVNRAVATLNDLKKQKRLDELYAFREHNKGTFKVKSQVRAIERYMDNWRRKRDNLLRRTDISAIAKSDMIRDMELSRDKRLAIVPALRQKADVPALSLFN